MTVCYRSLDNFDIADVIDLEVVAKGVGISSIRFEGKDFPAGANQSRKQKRIVTSMGAHVENHHASPYEGDDLCNMGFLVVA
jgi:hypothetical protein